MLYCVHMFLETSQDLFLLVASVCLLVVTGFLSWLLYEAARFFNQSNQLLENLRHKVQMVEDAVLSISDKLANLSQYVGFISEGSKKVMSYLEHKDEKPKARKKRAEPTLDEIEGEEM